MTRTLEAKITVAEAETSDNSDDHESLTAESIRDALLKKAKEDKLRGVCVWLTAFICLQSIQQIQNWFTNRRTKDQKVNYNPFQPLLDKLYTSSIPAPRQLAINRFYMKHPDFQGKVSRAYEAKWKDNEDEELSLARRVLIANELWIQETDEVRERILKEQEAQYEKETMDWKKLLLGLIEEPTEEQKAA